MKTTKTPDLLIFRTIMNDDERKYFMKARGDGERMISHIIQLIAYLSTIL